MITRDAFGLRPLAFGLALTAAVGCGKKGPPLAPLLILPGPVANVSATRFGDQVIVQFTPPAKNTDNSTPADLARVDIYALSVQDEKEITDAADLLREGARVGSLDMAPKPSPDGSPPEEAAGTRTFSETLTPEAQKLWEGKKLPDSRASQSPRGQGSVLSAAELRTRGTIFWMGPIDGLGGAGVVFGELPPQPMRLYAFVPVSTRGRRGALTLIGVPLADSPPLPSPPLVTHTETALELSWVAVTGVRAYNVYEREPPASASKGSIGATPLNQAPLEKPAFEDKRIEFGKARCYSVTSVATVATRRIESPMSDPTCVTAEDTFPPPAPTSLAAVAGPGAISLIWDAVASADLAGYLVLRADAPGGTLQALTPEPIKDTTYRDAAVTPGIQYAYAVVAVDRSKNRSAPSARVEETAR